MGMRGYEEWLSSRNKKVGSKHLDKYREPVGSLTSLATVLCQLPTFAFKIVYAYNNPVCSITFSLEMYSSYVISLSRKPLGPISMMRLATVSVNS